MGICMLRETRDEVGLGEGIYISAGRGVLVLHDITN